MSKINYYWNELYDECIERFNASYETMMDTPDYVPASHIKEQQNDLLKKRKKVLKRISREERRFRRRLGRGTLRYYEVLEERWYLDKIAEYYAKEKNIIVEGEVVDVSKGSTVADGKSLIVQGEVVDVPKDNTVADVPAEKPKGGDVDVRA